MQTNLNNKLLQSQPHLPIKEYKELCVSESANEFYIIDNYSNDDICTENDDKIINDFNNIAKITSCNDACDANAPNNKKIMVDKSTNTYPIEELEPKSNCCKDLFKQIFLFGIFKSKSI